jgi:hypothetical protein
MDGRAPAATRPTSLADVLRPSEANAPRYLEIYSRLRHSVFAFDSITHRWLSYRPSSAELDGAINHASVLWRALREFRDEVQRAERFEAISKGPADEQSK